MKDDTSSPRPVWLRKAFFLSFAAIASSKTAFGDSKITQQPCITKIIPLKGKCVGCAIFFVPEGASSPGKGMMGSRKSGMKGCNSGTCQVVAGKIIPMGYCILYSPLPA